MLALQYPQPVSDTEVGPREIGQVLPVLTGQRGGGELAGGEDQSGEVAGRRQGPRHVHDANKTTRGNSVFR